jgi:hypothetical protein
MHQGGFSVLPGSLNAGSLHLFPHPSDGAGMANLGCRQVRTNLTCNGLQVLSSMVHVTGASALSDERTLQYFVTDSSTARAAFSGAMAGPCRVK